MKKAVQIFFLSLSILSAASGQVSEQNEKSPEHRVAVLPLAYIAEASDIKLDNMQYQLQEMTIDYLSKSAFELKFMNPAEINAILLKSGITQEKMRHYTPKELAALLNVEYIIMGTVMQDKGKIITVSNSHKEERGRIEDRRREVRVRERTDRHNTSVTGQEMETQVTLSIYNDNGEKIYSQSRHSMWGTSDGYKMTLSYLLKRTPLYKR